MLSKPQKKRKTAQGFGAQGRRQERRAGGSSSSVSCSTVRASAQGQSPLSEPRLREGTSVRGGCPARVRLVGEKGVTNRPSVTGRPAFAAHTRAFRHREAPGSCRGGQHPAGIGPPRVLSWAPQSPPKKEKARCRAPVRRGVVRDGELAGAARVLFDGAAGSRGTSKESHRSEPSWVI